MRNGRRMWAVQAVERATAGAHVCGNRKSGSRDAGEGEISRQFTDFKPIPGRAQKRHQGLLGGKPAGAQGDRGESLSQKKPPLLLAEPTGRPNCKLDWTLTG